MQEGRGMGQSSPAVSLFWPVDASVHGFILETLRKMKHSFSRALGTKRPHSRGL